ncbi:MAG: acetate--CoA ligase, partial [Gemmatimonadetes bacterium]|nr:acetate--CoA ligase [Gemmatimonadota bacterium]
MTDKAPKDGDHPTLDALLDERRVFEPSADFRDKAVLKDEGVYEEAEDYEAFWARWADELQWIRPWDQVLDWNPPRARWFDGGRINVCSNCVDRHLDGPRRHKTAILWEGEPGDRRSFTYYELHEEVSRFANVLKSLGVGKGDRVAIYLPMIPEAAFAMLACARIGAPHSVVFGGFSPDSLADRINDAEAKVLVTADGGYRRGGVVPLKENADRAVEKCPSIDHVLVVARDGEPGLVDVGMTEGRDLWYHEVALDTSTECQPEAMEAEDVLYILYTSGTTGKPKGVVHTTGGYLTQVYATTKVVFDLKEDDVYWCTADVGWVTGHSYIVYGPLANGATVLMYEGAPDFPDQGRFWKICDDYGVSVFYTAPTAIRAFMRWGDQWPERYDLTSLRLLGTVGEPINPEAWMWYHDVIGGGRCPIVDTWWQTETGGIMITPLPGLTPTRPGSACRPFPGIQATLLDDDGEEVTAGYLAITRPWPAMLRTIWGDEDRFRETYWSKWPGLYFPGDGAKLDEDGYLWILGRVDDVLNVAGHRIGTMEVESALVDHTSVVEAAVVGRHDDIKGQAIAAFVTVKDGVTATPDLGAELKVHVADRIGPIARPADVIFTADLPKTRSGKIMRRL